MDFDNPAYRLLTILEEGKKIDINLNCAIVWARLLNVSTDSPDLFARMGKVMELPSLAVSAICSAYPDEPNTWAHWVGQVQQGFRSQSLNQPWSTFINVIDNHSINYLKIHSKLLQLKSNFKPVDQDVLENSRQGLSEVLELLLAANDIEDEVRISLSRNIRKLINSIEEYKLTGSIGIFDSLEILIGHSYFDQKYANAIKKSSIAEKITNLLSVLANAMTIAQGLPMLRDSVKTLLDYVKTAS